MSDTEKRNEIASLRSRWQQLDVSLKDAFFKEMADRNDLEWKDVVEDLVPAVKDSQVPLRVIEDTAILAEVDTLDRIGTIMFKSREIFPMISRQMVMHHRYKLPENTPDFQIQVAYKVEKRARDDFLGDGRSVVRKSQMETRINHYNGPGLGFTDASHDLFKVIHCADVLNFVFVTKGVETMTKHVPRLLDRTELVVDLRKSCEEVPGQYWDFIQKIIAHFHFSCGWLLTDVPHYRNEAIYLRHWLLEVIDGLTAECKAVFPKSRRGRRRYPDTWRSQTLDGCLTWSEFINTQPLLKSWIEALMTADDIWNLAAIDTTLDPGQRASEAAEVGKTAALRVRDDKAKASAANEGGGSQPTEDTLDIDEDAVMEDLVPETTPNEERVTMVEAPMHEVNPAPLHDSDDGLPPKFKLQKRRSIKFQE